MKRYYIKSTNTALKQEIDMLRDEVQRMEHLRSSEPEPVRQETARQEPIEPVPVPEVPKPRRQKKDIVFETIDQKSKKQRTAIYSPSVEAETTFKAEDIK